MSRKPETEQILTHIINLRDLVKDQILFFNQIANTDEEIKNLDNSYICINVDTRKSYLKTYLKKLNAQIEAKCTHNYVYDDIDIEPEQSQKIRYCTICFDKGVYHEY